MGKNKGVINVFIGEDLHAELKIEAARRRLSLKDLVIEKLSRLRADGPKKQRRGNEAIQPA